MNVVITFVKNLLENETNLLNELKINNIVIESTSRCNLQCEMCPRNSVKQTCGDFDLNLFKKLSKYFKKNMVVNLAGWGEPLLHPRLIEMVRIAKRRGVIIGFTTNATLMDIEISEKLIKGGLDFIDFSLDGATQKTYEQIRRGAKFNEVINNIRKFIEIKNSLSKKALHTSITFVMMKQNIHELPLMVKLTKDLKVEFLNAKNFDVLSSKEDIEKVVFSHDKYNKSDNNFIKFRDDIIANTVSLANDLNLNLEINPFVINESKKCKLASTGIFISHFGEVTICCATGHHVPRMLDRTNTLENAKIIYGNLNTSELTKILTEKRYIECKNKAAQDIIPIECKGCLLSEGL